jgi:hypothetical protein
VFLVRAKCMQYPFQGHILVVEDMILTFWMGSKVTKMLAWAACVRCHSTKCPLLMALFLFLSSAGLLSSQKELSYGSKMLHRAIKHKKNIKKIVGFFRGVFLRKKLKVLRIG